ncbi:MAG: DUF305 domain-containing protein [Gemmatimonadetes bacterium]|nr:DUF305 domain-containing protein [Gemmatimonadota bacterium]
MRAPRFTVTALLVAGVLAFTPIGEADAQVITESQRSTMSTAEMEAIIRARRDSARMRYSQADVRFMNMMISHHAQALVMANMGTSHGASPSVKVLAGRIISSQEDEIATMQQWLRDRRLPAPEVHIRGTTVMIHAGEHGGVHDSAHMPGMLTQEQLDRLDKARGAEFDRLLLTFMIQHHRGAVTMVHELFATDGAGQDEEVFKFASDVQVDQTTEVARMELMLSQMSNNGRAP